jgi:hypothetical protein
MAIGMPIGSFIANNNINGSMVALPLHERSQKHKRWSGLPDQSAAHGFWSHSNDLRKCLSCLAAQTSTREIQFLEGCP